MLVTATELLDIESGDSLALDTNANRVRIQLASGNVTIECNLDVASDVLNAIKGINNGKCTGQCKRCTRHDQ